MRRSGPNLMVTLVRWREIWESDVFQIMNLSLFWCALIFGNFAITTVGKINNMDELIANCFKNGCTHFLEMSGGSVNPTENGSCTDQSERQHD